MVRKVSSFYHFFNDNNYKRIISIFLIIVNSIYILNRILSVMPKQP